MSDRFLRSDIDRSDDRSRTRLRKSLLEPRAGEIK